MQHSFLSSDSRVKSENYICSQFLYSSHLNVFLFLAPPSLPQTILHKRTHITLIFLTGFFCFGHPHFLNNLAAPWRVGLCAHKGPCGLPRPTPGADSCSGGTSNSGVPCGKPQPAGQSGPRPSVKCDSRLQPRCHLHHGIEPSSRSYWKLSQTQSTHLIKKK